MHVKKRTTNALICTVVLSAALRGADAQSQAAPARQAPTVLHVDKAFGFELQIPADWRYDRSGAFGPGGSLILLRGAAPGDGMTLQILMFQDLRQPFDQWIDVLSKELGTMDGARWVQVKRMPGTSRPAAYVTAQAVAGIEQVETAYYCTMLNERTAWAMSLAGKLPKSAGADDPATRAEKPVPPLLEQWVGTLRITGDAKSADAVREALSRGRAFLDHFRLSESIKKLRLDQNLRYYEIILAGEPIGYMTRRFSREQHGIDESARSKDAKDGLRVRESTWRFSADGSARYSVLDLFSSTDNETDLYEIWDSTLPAQSVGSLPVATTHDQCVREGDVLFSSYSNSVDRWLPEPRRPIRLESGFLGLVWMRAMPAMISPDAVDPIGFTIYDVQTRALIAHVLRPLGKAEPADGPGAALAFETREGLVDTMGRLVTDTRGNMVRFDAGALSIRLSDAAAIEKAYGPRRAAAKARLAKSSDVRD